MNKYGYILSPGDLFRGFVIGFIAGAVVMFLLSRGILPNPVAGAA